MPPKTRGGSSARCRRSKRLKQSDIVDDVVKDQVDESAPVNSSPVHASVAPDAGSPDALEVISIYPSRHIIN